MAWKLFQYEIGGVKCIVKYLVKTVLTAIADIHYFDDLGSKSTIKHITLAQLGLEVGTSSEDQTSHVDLVVCDKVLNCVFGDFAHVVVAFFVTETGETKSRLTTTSVLLGEVDSKLVDDLSRVASECTEEGAVTIHDDETKLGVGLQEFGQGFSMELVVAKVERTVRT